MSDEHKNFFEQQEEFLEKLRAERLKLRERIKEIVAEEAGVELSMEEDFSKVIDKLPLEQQKVIIQKVRKAQGFPPLKDL